MTQVLVNGLAIGGVYALLAVSFLLMFQVSGLLNFAQAQFVMAGAFIGATAATGTAVPVWLACVAGVVGAGLIGIVMERVTYRPLRGKSVASMIIATVAVGIVLTRATELIWGAEPRSMPSLVPAGTLDLLGARVSTLSLLIIAISAVLLTGQHLMLTRTRLGRMLRATALDAETAQLMGIRTNLLVVLAFVLGGALAGAAGLLVAPTYSVTTDIGTLIALKAFAACVIGGFGNLLGAAAAAVGLGVVENLAGSYVATDSKDPVAFALLILFLVIRPQGLFGEPVGEKL